MGMGGRPSDSTDKNDINDINDINDFIKTERRKRK
jgi:hypothetical protein